MIFNSLGFAIFLPIVFFCYWFLTKKNWKKQNLILLISSYLFYSFWDWRFLFLLIFSTFLDYSTGLLIYKSKNRNNRLIWLWLSISLNLGFIGVFKYYNFFVDSFSALLQLFGLKNNITTLQVILPVGISFYTFHGLSYVIDLYYKRIKPEINFMSYSLFVSFFPLLVAGPIERATHLLPQINIIRNFNYIKAVDGLRQILWGLFKKIVIADNCAEYANQIFNNSSDYSGTTLLLGALFFTFQIYGDFSGYSDIALGTARLFGIELLRNFAFPYFSRDIAEFWRRWHISLSSWFRDYLYIPLGGSHGSTIMQLRNSMIVFLISGLWHGANWTFIFWGLLNAIYLIPQLLYKTNRNNIEIVAKGKLFPSLNDLLAILFTFSLTVFAWIFFRADSLYHAINFIGSMVNGLQYKANYVQSINFLFWEVGIAIPILIFAFITIEWLGREDKYAIENIGLKLNRNFRWLFYSAIVLTIFYFTGKDQQFIYFQF